MTDTSSAKTDGESSLTALERRITGIVDPMMQAGGAKTDARRAEMDVICAVMEAHGPMKDAIAPVMNAIAPVMKTSEQEIQAMWSIMEVIDQEVETI